MARYLITGIAGFIGSSLAHELLKQGHEVRGVDDLSTGNMRNLDSILNHIDFRHLDINETDRLRGCCQGIDFVLHQAAIASVPRSIRDPLASHAANIDGTLSVLLAARDAGVSRVIYAASSSAYGDRPDQPKHERMLPNPMSPYAAQKLAGEHYIRSFFHVYGLEGVCLRYFNVFGPRQGADSPYSGVIARFISDMLCAKVPVIFGDGSHSRDFTFIDNVVSANLLACVAPGAVVAGETYNVGTGSSHTLSELYATLASLLSFCSPPRFERTRLGDIAHSEADLTRAARDLKYLPITSFHEGMQATVNWYVQQASRNPIQLPRQPIQDVHDRVGQSV